MDDPLTRFTHRRFQASLVVVGGDGAVAKGGEDARLSSTKSADMFFRDIFPTAPNDLTWWDLFHRNEIAASRAFKRVELAVEVFDVATVMLQLFGIGQGRVLLRSVAASLGDDEEYVKLARESEPSYTRPMAYSHRVCGSLIKNFRVHHAGLEVRMEQTRKGQGGQTLRKLVDVGRRSSAVDFVVFLLGLRDVSLRLEKTFAMLSEKTEVEAAVLFREALALQAALVAYARHVVALREWIFVSLVALAY